MLNEKGINFTQCDVMWPEYLPVHVFCTLQMLYQPRRKILNTQILVQKHPTPTSVFLESWVENITGFIYLLSIYLFIFSYLFIYLFFWLQQCCYSNKTNGSYNCNVGNDKHVLKWLVIKLQT